MQQRKEPKYAAEEPWGGEHCELASPRTEAVAEKETQAQAEQPKDTAWKNAANAADTISLWAQNALKLNADVDYIKTGRKRDYSEMVAEV